MGSVLGSRGDKVFDRISDRISWFCRGFGAQPLQNHEILSETLSPRDPKTEPKSYPFPLTINGELGSGPIGFSIGFGVRRGGWGGLRKSGVWR